MSAIMHKFEVELTKRQARRIGSMFSRHGEFTGAMLAQPRTGGLGYFAMIRFAICDAKLAEAVDKTICSHVKRRP